MFCAVFSNTNAAGSAASNSNPNSDSSRINSPSAVPSSSNPITTTTTQVKSDSSLSPVECIDNTGSPNNEGYGQGYVDRNRDAREGNTYDNVLHNHHTQGYQTGYHDGYTTGFSDGKIGVSKNPC